MECQVDIRVGLNSKILQDECAEAGFPSAPTPLSFLRHKNLDRMVVLTVVRAASAA